MDGDQLYVSKIDASKNFSFNLIFPLAVVFVFLVLARARCEKLDAPVDVVMLVVPMCILGSLTGVAISHGDINIFTQIGFVVLVGLASKNAILIVEFAKHKRESGLSRRDATLDAVKLRLRPILMTSFAFILGVVPLILPGGRGRGLGGDAEGARRGRVQRDARRDAVRHLPDAGVLLRHLGNCRVAFVQRGADAMGGPSGTVYLSAC